MKIRTTVKPQHLILTFVASWLVNHGGLTLNAAEHVAASHSAKSSSNAETEVTPTSIPGSEAVIYRHVGKAELRLFIVEPKHWSASDQRPCMVCFFGGGWSSGTPLRSIGWAKWAASHGLVGVAPDYRTRHRFAGTPEDCVADGRAAVEWVETHAAELGIDPHKIIAQGGSAGGHVAAWTAIPGNGPDGKSPAPKIFPAVLVLLNPVTDTKADGYGGPKRFGHSAARALACSVPDQMPTNMPPTIVFHSTGDQTVPYTNSVAFRDLMVRHGNRCELVTFQGLGHAYYARSKYGQPAVLADQKTHQDVEQFLENLGLMKKHTNGSTKLSQ